MKNLKHILSLFLLQCLVLPAFAQKGFEVIKKAETKHLNGQHKKALKLLSKAEKMNFGFCGNAWMDADREINLLKAKIYIKQENYQFARNSLDSIGVEYRGDNLDSIRIRTYQMEFGKEFLSSVIDSSLNHSEVTCGEYECYVSIPLTKGKEIKLKPNPMSNFELIYLNDEKQKSENWLLKFKDSENYKLIKEKS